LPWTDGRPTGEFTGGGPATAIQTSATKTTTIRPAMRIAHALGSVAAATSALWTKKTAPSHCAASRK
jgi:hypothetical protein